MGNKSLEVSLIGIPSNLLDVIYTACRTCYSADGAVDIFNNVTDDKEKKLSLIKRIISSGHYSTIEHIQLTFAINNISRAATHQLVRHRHMSFSQKSQRYVKEADFDYIVPVAIEKSSELLKKFNAHMEATSKLYTELVEAGIKKEDARSILPNATASSIVCSLNLRELIHLANLRLCTRAQLEIRMAIAKMCALVIEQEPWLTEHLVPKCERLGYCDEDNSCGRKPTKNG
ncbi:MAG: FAD-dependent thymidylate synthase [Candidatus Gastranaerophilales bacterium]|nr:FAD-dependent thymidylate synthase [Candidatus Gastranaerophilales bacterium]